MVLDASAALAWIYKEEPIRQLDLLGIQLEEHENFVPQLWRLELANVLLTNVRRQRHGMQFVQQSIADFAKYRLSVDEETDAHVLGQTLRLAEAHHLTIYDACYLELALRRSLPLATLDKRLQEAGRAAGAVPFWS